MPGSAYGRGHSYAIGKDAELLIPNEWHKGQKSFSSGMEPKDSFFCSYSIYLISSHILLGLAVFLSHAFSLHSGCQSFSVPSTKSNITVKNSAQNDDHANPLRPAYGFSQD